MHRLTLFAAGAVASVAFAAHPPPAAQGRAAAAPTHTSTDALALVKRIYDPYANATVDTPLLGNCFLPATGRPCFAGTSDSLTASLRSRLRRRAVHEDADPVGCAQNVPRRVTYGVAFSQPGTATIIVHALYAGSGDAPIRVGVNLRSLKLSAITCEPAPDLDPRVTTWNPLRADGRLRPGLRARSAQGYCIGEAAVPLATPAQRCFERSTVRDPCFEPAGGIDPIDPIVLCAGSPWRHTVVRLHLTPNARIRRPALPPAAFGASKPQLPWAIRLAGGERCVYADGTTTAIGTRRLNYTCGDGPNHDRERLDLYGTIDRAHRTWRIQATRHTGDRRLRPVVVAHIWR